MRTAILIIGLALVLAAACGGGSDTQTTVREGRDVEAVETGIPELDHALNAALRLELIELAGLTGYQSVPCVEEQEAEDDPPECREGESPDRPIEAYPLIRCGLVWLRPEVMADTYGAALGAAPELVAVYRPAEKPLVLDADYIAVFDADADPAKQAGAAFLIKEGRIIQVEYSCGDFSTLYADDRVDEFVVEPNDPPATPPAMTQ
jgi:hypothetical protein